MSSNTNASASAFGWDFQIHAAIYLMLKYFSKVEKLKVESNSEDIELFLKNSKKIYAQAKAEQLPFNSNSAHSTTLREALKTLSAKEYKIAEQLIYINNLEPNPLNSGTNEFNGSTTILTYDDLMPESKEKIDTQLSNLNVSKDFPKDKFTIIKLPFHGTDPEQRVKSIVAKIVDFASYTDEINIDLSSRLLEIWTSDFLHNATIEDDKVWIEKNEIIWKMIILCIDSTGEHRFTTDYQVDEEVFQNAITMYKRVINYKEGKFNLYNQIIKLHEKYKIKNQFSTIFEFINSNVKEIYNLVFEEEPIGDLIKITCSKIVAYRIILRKESYKKIQRSAENYGD